jgi:long-chain acyl-CoA synthetase
MIDWWRPVIHEAYAASELGSRASTATNPCASPARSADRSRAWRSGFLAGDGAELPSGTAGLIHARSVAVPDFTYANNDEARCELEQDRLWTLRDTGFVDDHGYLHLVDR